MRLNGIRRTALHKLSGILRRAGIDPDKRAAKYADQISVGYHIAHIIESQDWVEGLKPLIDKVSEDFNRILRIGHETDTTMDKARGAMDAIDSILRKMDEAIEIGRKAEEQLTKEKAHARRT